jgi:hypothetical protein
LLGGEGGLRVCGDDEINLERDQFTRESGKPLELPLGRSVFDHEVAPLDVAKVMEPMAKGVDDVGVGRQAGRYVPYARDLRWLLGRRDERGEELDEEKDEGARRRRPFIH